MKQEIVKVLSERQPLYAQAAVIEINTEEKDSIQIADEIITFLNCSSGK